VSAESSKPQLSLKLLSELMEISGDKQRVAFLRRRKLLRAATVLELNAATQKEFRANTKSALLLAEAAVLVAKAIGKSLLLAQSYRVQANVLAASGEYRPAIALYEKALALFEKEKDNDGIARTLTAAIQPHIMLGAYDEAFAAADRAQKLFTKLGDDRRRARLENNIGNIYHRQDRFEEALAHYETAYHDLLPHGDSEELTISLNNMSMCLISMNDFAQALSTYKRAKDLLREKDLPLIHLITDYNIAYLYYLRGDYRRAIEMLKSARVVGEKIGYTYLVALCYLDLSDIYVELNLSAEVQEVAEQGYRLFQKLQIGYEAAKTLANRAIAFGQDGKIRSALELFAEAKPLFIKEDNVVWPWLIDLYHAIMLFQEGRHYEARRLAVGAAGFFDSSFLKSKAALCHFLLSQIAIRTGDLREAHAECSLALAALKAVDAPILHYQGHFLLGQIQHSRGDFPAAYAEYQRARTELESLRSNLGRDELKISFMKNKTEIYERLVELCLDVSFEGASPEEAFQYIELAKSRSLTELIFQKPHALPEVKPGQSDLVHRIRDLREELNWYQHRIEQEQLRPEKNSAERIEKLHTEAQEREKSLLKILGELPNTETEAAAFSPQPEIPLAKVQRLLGDDTTLLEYFFTGEKIMAAVATKNALQIVPVSTVPRVAQSLRLLRFQLSKFQVNPSFLAASGEGAFRATVAHLEDLYGELLAPVRSQLATRHLVIVPHGLLHYLPFHALHDGACYLLDSFTVSYSPSATVYALCHRPLAHPGKDTLILGVPDERAPLIQNEVESVHEILPGSELFLGGTASHDLLLRKAPSSKFIHIATHGSFRPDNPMFSGIRLSDGYLHLYELYHMQLSAELLTLSGCATGLNVIAGGDELLGLIRGLLYAGARSLLLSLWDVNDHTTAQFMTSFYRRIQQSDSKPEALAAAAKEIREHHPHPYYWAPFVLVGKALSGEMG
jgi:CHAT domain-containing protein/predicted negative regulator of RcsB-dependent stress response